jgi:hypothetical protein
VHSLLGLTPRTVSPPTAGRALPAGH